MTFICIIVFTTVLLAFIIINTLIFDSVNKQSTAYVRHIPLENELFLFRNEKIGEIIIHFYMIYINRQSDIEIKHLKLTYVIKY